MICNQQVRGSSPFTSSTSNYTFLHTLPEKGRGLYGRVPEWPKGADCKSVVFDFSGSNPLSPTKLSLCRYAQRTVDERIHKEILCYYNAPLTLVIISLCIGLTMKIKPIYKEITPWLVLWHRSQDTFSSGWEWQLIAIIQAVGTSTRYSSGWYALPISIRQRAVNTLARSHGDRGHGAALQWDFVFSPVLLFDCVCVGGRLSGPATHIWPALTVCGSQGIKKRVFQTHFSESPWNSCLFLIWYIISDEQTSMRLSDIPSILKMLRPLSSPHSMVVNGSFFYVWNFDELIVYAF